jgi:hypothetical protein
MPPRKKIVTEETTPARGTFQPEVNGDVSEAVRQCLGALGPLTETERQWVLKSAASFPWGNAPEL